MFSLLSNVAGLIFGAFQWLTGYFQRQAGKQEQQTADAEELNRALAAELDAANQHIGAIDSLHDHDF